MKRQFQEERICRNCGKTIYVLHPSRWAYKHKKGGESFDYFCTWKCMREEEKGKKSMSNKITPEKRAEAIRIAIEGGDVLAFLGKNGSKAPDKLWYYIKSQLKKKDPETYAKLPKKKAEEQDGTMVYKTKKQMAEVAKKVPEVIVVPHDAIDKADNYPTLKMMTRKEHKEALRTTMTMDNNGIRIETVKAPKGLEIAMLKSMAVPGACFVKAAEPKEGGMEPIMKMEYPDTLIKMGVTLRMNKAGWMNFIDEINAALVQMEI